MKSSVRDALQKSCTFGNYKNEQGKLCLTKTGRGVTALSRAVVKLKLNLKFFEDFTKFTTLFFEMLRIIVFHDATDL